MRIVARRAGVHRGGMAALRLAAAMLILGCGSRPLTIDVEAAGVGGRGGAPGTAGAGGVGGFGRRVGQYRGAHRRRRRGRRRRRDRVRPRDHAGGGLPGRRDAGPVQSRAHRLRRGRDRVPGRCGVRVDDARGGRPGLRLSEHRSDQRQPAGDDRAGVPAATMYWVAPHEQIGATFDFLIDYAVTDGTVVHFTACPATLSAFCRGGRRLSFDVTVHPAVFPTWIPMSGRPAGSPPCSSTAPASDRVCGNLDTLSFSNPRAVVWQNSGALFVSPTAWLTNDGPARPNVCVRAATGGRTSSVAYAAVPAGKSAHVGTSPIEIDPDAARGREGPRHRLGRRDRSRLQQRQPHRIRRPDPLTQVAPILGQMRIPGRFVVVGLLLVFAGCRSDRTGMDGSGGTTGAAGAGGSAGASGGAGGSGGAGLTGAAGTVGSAGAGATAGTGATAGRGGTTGTAGAAGTSATAGAWRRHRNCGRGGDERDRRTWRHHRNRGRGGNHGERGSRGHHRRGGAWRRRRGRIGRGRRRGGQRGRRREAPRAASPGKCAAR